jgi:hypothetical protein
MLNHAVPKTCGTAVLDQLWTIQDTFLRLRNGSNSTCTSKFRCPNENSRLETGLDYQLRFIILFNVIGIQTL